MPLSDEQARNLLEKARNLIGESYEDIDCSHFVYEAYKDAGLEYPYRSTAAFVDLVGPAGYFEAVPDAAEKKAGDVILFSGHMGIWDPDGCTAVVPKRQECMRLQNDAPLLSSRSSGNRGPDFGQVNWFGSYKVYRWSSR